MHVYVLTKESNEYNQEGEYFVAVFAGPPHHTQLRAAGVPQHRLRHVLSGGGRVDNEYEWFHLFLTLCQPARGAPATEPTQRELDDFIVRAGFRYGWENLESWARRMAERAVLELKSKGGS
ncbi:MAG: hypothetical protein RLZZ524_2361 [Pseudomonadota bacterium]